jgi:hypothetical protein
MVRVMVLPGPVFGTMQGNTTNTRDAHCEENAAAIDDVGHQGIGLSGIITEVHQGQVKGFVLTLLFVTSCTRMDAGCRRGGAKMFRAAGIYNVAYSHFIPWEKSASAPSTCVSSDLATSARLSLLSSGKKSRS